MRFPDTNMTLVATVGFFFMMVGAVLIVVGVMRRMARGADAPDQTENGSYRAAVGDDPFETRVAARIAELQTGGGQGISSDDQTPPAPGARGFGRKGA